MIELGHIIPMTARIIAMPANIVLGLRFIADLDALSQVFLVESPQFVHRSVTIAAQENWQGNLKA